MALEMKTVFLAMCLGFGVHCDPCEEYEVLTGNYRSVHYGPEFGERLKCDNLFVTTGRWYMFQDDLGNPRTLWGECVPILHCGTQFPIWLEGEHPTSYNEDEKAYVCANVAGCRRGGCDWREIILIRRCPDDTFRYQLKTPPCVASYCSGDATTCSDGLVWDPIRQECTRITPLITMRPEIHPPVVVETDQSYDFYIPCEIKYTPDRAVDGALFDAVFLFNGVADENTRKVTDENNLVVRLNSAELAGHIGTAVQCDVQAFWEDSPHKSTAIRSENHWFVGITIYDNTTGVFGELAPPITVSEAMEKPRELYLVSSIPITCTHNFLCVLNVTVRSIGDDGLSSAFVFSLLQSDWDDDSNRVYNSQPLLLSVLRTSQRKEDKIFAIDFDPISFFGSNIWNNYDVPDVQVQYRDYDRSYCKSTGDPHITTFDGRYYHVVEAGVFVYVRSSSSRIFEVQVRHFICSPWNVGCICGVVVREGNTILGVDACGFYHDRQTHKSPHMIQYSATRDRWAAIYSDTRNRFAICMGSGACVRMTIRNRYTDIYIDGIEEDFGKTTGLCGTFNGDNSDEFTTPDGTVTSCPTGYCSSYSNQWLVPNDQNLFLTRPELVTVEYPQPELCKCPTQGGQEVVCGSVLNTGGANIPQDPQQVATVPGNGRKRRSTALYTDHIVTKRSTHFVQKRQTTEYTWPTPKGITEENANQRCREPIVAATAYTKCFQLFGEAIFDGVFACVEDIKISDNVAVSNGSAVEGMEVICKEKVFQLQRTAENEGTNTDPVNIMKDVEQDVCPSQCSEHGQCQDGACTCYPEYIGADCSVQQDRPPSLNAVESETDGTCDVRERPCRIAFLDVDNVMNSDNLICKVSPVQYDENGQRQVGEAMNVAASIRSRWEMTCPLPETPVSLNSSLSQPGASVYGFMVSVSNDGNTFSSESELTIFDSVCQSCDSPGNCVRQEGSCVINGHCFESGKINRANSCQQCIPQKSVNSWSIRSLRCIAMEAEVELHYKK